MICWPDLPRPALLSAVLLALAPSFARAEPATYADRVAPLLDRNCTVCHGAEKHKAGLRLDSYAAILQGAESGAVVKPGDLKGSEMYRRITLPTHDEDFMPSDGKPPLGSAEVVLLEKWIAAGAPETAAFDAPPLPPVVIVPPAAPDYRSRLAQANELARTLGVQLVPRSQVSTDGLIVRTASAPAQCNDAVLAKLAPVADLIVEAELARTKITDAGLRAVAAWVNLQRLDLTRTAVTSAGMIALAPLSKLEAINLTSTKVDDQGLAVLQANPALQKIWVFASAATPVP